MCVQCLMVGVKSGVIGLPLAFMILIESKRFVETGAYYSAYLLLGVLVMASFMARLLVERYSEE